MLLSHWYKSWSHCRTLARLESEACFPPDSSMCSQDCCTAVSVSCSAPAFQPRETTPPVPRFRRMLSTAQTPQHPSMSKLHSAAIRRHPQQTKIGHASAKMRICSKQSNTTLPCPQRVRVRL